MKTRLLKTHILLIDDDIDEVRVFVEALKDVMQSFKCTYAANGSQAMKMLHYLRPQVIFADYHMSAMNGLRVAEEVKKIKHLRHIPFFLYGPNISSATREKAMQLGISGCMETPSNIAGLSALLKEVFPEDD